jgi:hypothetical protein
MSWFLLFICREVLKRDRRREEGEGRGRREEQLKKQNTRG